MTDEELEKKANESYAKKLKDSSYYETGEEGAYICGYIAGAKENQPTVEEMLKRLLKGGYVKSGICEKKEHTQQWHSVDDGDFPKENKLYLVFGYTNKSEMFYELDVFEPTEEEFLGCGENVTAWCEIPKFEEE